MADLEFSLGRPSEVQTIMFSNENGTLITIHRDGRIDRGPAFTTVDESSLEFWRLLSLNFPAFLQSHRE